MCYSGAHSHKIFDFENSNNDGPFPCQISPLLCQDNNGNTQRHCILGDPTSSGTYINVPVDSAGLWWVTVDFIKIYHHRFVKNH